MTCQRKLQKHNKRRSLWILITNEKTREYFEEAEGEIYYVKAKGPIEYNYIGKQILSFGLKGLERQKWSRAN